MSTSADNPPPEPSASEIAAAQRTLYNAGLHQRRKVTGPSHVSTSLANATPFTQPLQNLVTANAWGSIWTRPGLDHRARSLINMAMLAAMGKSGELVVHVRGAVRNGVSVEEIREVVLQVAVYAGFPAGLEAMRTAKGVLEDMVEKGELEREKLEGLEVV